MKNTLFAKLLTIGLPLALAAYIFSGCASSGSSKETTPPGTLTVTGIPAEYEGKFLKVEICNIPDTNAKIQTSGAIAKAEDRAIKGDDRFFIAIKDDKVDLPLYIFKVFGKGNGYAGNDTTDVRLEIRNREEYYFALQLKAIIASVTFEGGAAEVNWDNAVVAKPITITVTNIPEKYTRGSNIQIAEKLTSIAGIFSYEGITGQERGNISNGTTTVTIFPLGKDQSGNYATLPINATVDIGVSLTPPSNSSGVTIDDAFLFSAVPLNDGKAELDFRNIKQK